jgi:nuclease S1
MLMRKRGRQRQSSRASALYMTTAVAVLLFPASVWAWGSDGHKIVAVIAADKLTAAARSHVASILGVAADKRSIATAMEKASNLPDDSEFRKKYPDTKPWHFIDICLRDRRADVAASCGIKGCVTEKINDYSKRLKEGKYDSWGAQGDLAFLIHFVGDIHQPLHAANNADEGGNCVRVDPRLRAENLHAVWDNTIVRRLEDGRRPETTAHKLEKEFAGERETDSWIPADDIAWESNQIAHAEIYEPLRLPVEPCEPANALCSNQPNNEPKVDLDDAYLDHAETIAGNQLARAGFRLASLLNGIWAAPVNPNDATGAKPSTDPVSSNATADSFVGNRRSKIYAWPGCGSYNRMAPQNRVVFASREAAEQAGYRAALNCP